MHLLSKFRSPIGKSQLLERFCFENRPFPSTLILRYLNRRPAFRKLLIGLYSSITPISTPWAYWGMINY
jgi:hypothetical protein